MKSSIPNDILCFFVDNKDKFINVKYNIVTLIKIKEIVFFIHKCIFNKALLDIITNNFFIAKKYSITYH